MIKENGMFAVELKEEQEEIGKIVDKAIFGNFTNNKIQDIVEEFTLSEAEKFCESLDEILCYSELYPDRVWRYLELLKDKFEDRVEFLENNVTPRTTEQIMREYGLNEEDYH